MRKFILLSVAALLCVSTLFGQNAAKSDSPFLWTYSGQVANKNATPPTSHQAGDLYIPGAPADVSFTFETDATNVSVHSSGPLRIVERTGTTHVSATRTGKDRQEIAVASLRQIVVVDTTSGTFTTTNYNIIERANPVEGSKFSIATVGQKIRSSLTGHMNAPDQTPSGWFGGYAEAVP